MTITESPTSMSGQADPVAASAMPWLGKCISVPEKFLRDSFSVSPYLDRGARSRFRDLLTIPELDCLLAMRALRGTQVSIVKDGAGIASGYFVNADRRADGGYPDCGKIAGLVQKGGTLVVANVEEAAPGLFALCEGLGAELGQRVWANAYLTPPTSQGFSVHSDDHDVIVLQVAGAKHWRVFSRVEDEADVGRPVAIEPETAAMSDLSLTQGDALYVPRGWTHCAATTAACSLHVTIGMRHPQVVDALRYVFDHATIGSPLSKLLASRIMPARDFPQAVAAAARAIAEELSDAQHVRELAADFGTAWQRGMNRDESGHLRDVAALTELAMRK